MHSGMLEDSIPKVRDVVADRILYRIPLALEQKEDLQAPPEVICPQGATHYAYSLVIGRALDLQTSCRFAAQV